MAIAEEGVIFAQPWLAVAAVACAATPFLLHLLLRRPRVTAWPSTMLLQRAIERLQRRRRIERWLLLLTRSLALLLAGWTMAGPLLRAGTWEPRERWIVVDDAATAAERLPDGRTVIDWIREEARAAMQDLREGDSVALVSTAQPPRVTLPPTPDLQRALREVDALQVRAVPGKWKEAIDLALPASDTRSTARRELVLVGSFRRGSVDPDASLPTTWKTRLEGVRRWCSKMPADGSPNRSLGEVGVARSASSITASGQVPVRAQLLRTGRGAQMDAVTVKSVRGEAIGRTDASWGGDAAETRVDVSVRSTDGDAMVVEVSPDAQPLDDTVALASIPARELSVLVLGRRSGEVDLEHLPSSAWVTRALEAAGLRPQEVDPSTLALRSARDVDAVIACRPDLLDGAGWQWLGRFIQDGGTLVVTPVPGAAPQAWQAELARCVGREALMATAPQDGSFKLAARQPRTPLLSVLGAEIDALSEPVTVSRRWPLVQGSDATIAIVFEDGSPAMTVMRPRAGRGVVVTLATAPDLDCTDLPLKPLMVPLFQESVRAGRWIAATSQQARSGEIVQLGPTAAAGLLQPVDPSQGAAIEVNAEGDSVRPVPAPGLWKLKLRDGQERWVAVRLDPSAARIEPVERAAFDAWRSGLAPWQDSAEASASVVEASDSAASWAPWVFLVVLALLALEMPMARRGSPRASATAEVPA